MKKLILSLGLLMGLVVLGSPSYALRAGDSSQKTYLQQVLVSSANNGNAAFITATGSSGILMSIPGTPITGISYSNGATTGVISIYDASLAVPSNGGQSASTGLGTPEVGVQECVFEATVAANTGGYIDLSNAPINTVNGVVVLTSGTAGATVYTSNAINGNH
jgi:hypothetical protein